MTANERPCTFPAGCDHPIDATGLCTAHRSQRSRTGTMWPLWTHSRRIEDVIEDCEALAGSASANQIAERLGYACKRGAGANLYSVLRRAERLDLWRRITRTEAA